MQVPLKDTIITIAAAISAVGIPTLLGLIWRWHSTQLEALKLFTFKEVEAQVTALTKVNQVLRDYAAQLELRALDVPVSEIEEALKLVVEARELLHDEMTFLVDSDDGRHRLRLIFAEKNSQALENAKSILEKLSRHENRLRDMMSKDAVARLMTAKTSDQAASPEKTI